jgi:uridine nucleosidase
MVPLEVTHTAIVTDAVTARIRQLQQGRTLTHTAGKENNAAAGTDRSSRLMSFPVLLEELLFFFHSTYRDVFHFHTGPPLHDPCAIFYVLAPDAFTTTHWRVDVDTTSPLCKGTTVVDIWRQSALKPNVVVCQEMDVDRFWDAMLKALQRATDVSPLGGGL